MPFDSNGVFTRVMNWTSDQQNGIAIECGRHDQEDDNFAQGFNDTFCRDGRAAATGDFNMGTHKVQNLGNGTMSTDAVNKGQMDTGLAVKANNNTVVHLTGDESISGIKSFSNETRLGFVDSAGERGQLRLVTELYGMIFRNDGLNTYIFPTAQNDPYGTWSSTDKGLSIGNSDGIVSVRGEYWKGPAISDMGKSLSQNGYAKLSNGLIIQWMLTPDIYNYGTTITFPTPFTTTNYAICFNPFRSNPFNENATTVTERTTSTCKVYGKTYDGGSMSCPCFAIAIGY